MTDRRNSKLKALTRASHRCQEDVEVMIAEDVQRARNEITVEADLEGQARTEIPEMRHDE